MPTITQLSARTYDGTDFTIGLFDIYKDRARRSYFYKHAGTPTASVLGDLHTQLGIDLYAEAGSGDNSAVYHPSMQDLPLQTIRYTQISSSGSDTIWRIDLTYGRDRFATPSHHGSSGYLNVLTADVGNEPIEVFRHLTTGGESSEPIIENGLPGGSIVAVGDTGLRGYMWPRAVMKIRIPFSLSANPVASNAHLVGKINSDTLTYGSYAFAAHTLRYDGASYNHQQTPPTSIFQLSAGGPINTAGEARYAGDYRFTFCNGGWYRHVVAQTASEEGSFSVTTELMYQPAGMSF